MNRQSLDFIKQHRLPRYGDTEEEFEKGWKYIFKKKENAKEPPKTARALRKFRLLGDALEWSRNNLGTDNFIVVLI